MTTTTDQAPGLSVPTAQRAGTTVITKRFDFEAAHFLPNVAEDHKCRRVHGHSYEVIVHVTGPMDESAGWVVDFGDVKSVWKPLEERLDHHLLNDIEGLANPTAENLAAWIWERYEEERQAGRAGYAVAAVEVAETKDSKAMFVAPEARPWVPGHRVAALPRASRDAIDLDVPYSNGQIDPTPQEEAGPKHDGLEDVQDRPDIRGIALDEVGVSDVRLPITIMDRARTSQSTVATASLGVNVRAEKKGTHLSRFLRTLRDHGNEVSLYSLADLTRELRERLEGDVVRVRLDFPYFLDRPAPVTGESGSLDVDCAFEVLDEQGETSSWLEVTTPVTTVCPCSRDISDYGAHNQRGHVTIKVLCEQDEAELPSLVWIEELVEWAENSGSSPVYPVIRRQDERHVTMSGFDNPKFVEDVARDVALVLEKDPRIASWAVDVVNDESIHSHDAFARVCSSQ